MRLQVKLRDGFHDDTVIATVNGKEVFRKTNVRTDLTISFADAFEVEVEGPVAHLAIAVEGGAQATREVRVEETPFVEVSKSAGKLDLRESAEEVPMM